MSNEHDMPKRQPMDHLAAQASADALKRIMNTMDAYLYVTDPATDEILFINDKMRQLFAFQGDGTGEICWQVLQKGQTERCAFCPLHLLEKEPDKTITWEEQNTVTGRYYHNSDRLIEWTDGRVVHMQHSIDITDSKLAELGVRRQFDQQKLIGRISQSFLSGEDVAANMQSALKLLGEFMGADRAHLATYDADMRLLKSDYEWVSEALTDPPKRPYLIPFSRGSRFYDAFKEEKRLYMAVSDYDGAHAEAKNLHIQSFLAVAIYVDEQFYGLLEIDYTKARRAFDESDIHLSELVAGVLASVFTRVKLSKNLERMTAIIHNTPVFMAYIDGNGKFSYINPAASAMTGYSYDELMAGGINILHDDETLRRLFIDLLPHAFREKGFTYELPVIRKDGEARVFFFTCFPIEEAVGNVGLGMIANDVTEERYMRDELIRAKEAAERANSAKGDFLARMSHEIRTPMNAIIGMTAIARGAADTARKDYCLDKIDGASHHLLGVINDILDMSKIEANKFDIISADFEFEHMLINVTNMIAFRIDDKGQNMIVDLDPTLPRTLYGDEQRLSQVITNLLSNAVKFTPTGGTIRLDVKNMGVKNGIASIMVSVSDTGIGIPDEQQSRLFTLFEQVDGGTSRRYGGSGLGLAISKRIIDLMGGTISIESEENKGTTVTFVVQLPEGRTRFNAVLARGIDKEALRILAVDDSGEVRDYIRQMMASLELNCDVAEDGSHALDLVRAAGEHPYDIVFVDWMMPDMDGIALARDIRETTKHGSVVLMVSASRWKDIQRVAADAGIANYIGKPLFPSSLVNVINECMGLEAHGVAPDQDGMPDYSGHTIMLVEDVEINREIVRALLEGSNLAIECAENGEDALEMFAADPEKYELIFMDIHMPVMDGYETTRAIRALDAPSARRVPIVAMTANAFREDIKRCLESGMVDHMSKPINLGTLLDKLARYLRK